MRGESRKRRMEAEAEAETRGVTLWLALGALPDSYP